MAVEDTVNDPFSLGLLVGSIAVLGLCFLFFQAHGVLWFQSRASGSPVSFAALLGMRRRGSNPTLLVNALIMARKAGLDLSIEEIETYHRDGGDVVAAIRRMIEDRRAGRPTALRRPDA